MSSLGDRALAEIAHCNKCGFCLPACPTYRLTGNEVDSPRGRIALVEGVLQDEIPAGQGLQQSLSYCLGCRACETACPSGVQYHHVLEAGKAALDITRPQHRGLTFVPRTLLRLTRHPRRLRRLARLSRRVGALPLPASLKAMMPMLDYQTERIVSAPQAQTGQGEVLFFQGCVQEALFSDANQAAIELLRALGYQVAVPSRQTCCGALAWHAGRSEEARALAKRNIVAFEGQPDCWVINAAGGCGAMLSEYHEILADDPQWAQPAARFSQRVRDWTMLLDASGTEAVFAGAGDTVVLQNSCHLINVEQGGDAPARWLKRVEGDRFVALAGQDRCCGSAGIYNIQHPDWADALLAQKMDEVGAAHPTRVVVVNPGCHMQMTLGVARAGLNAPVEHLARYLYRAFLRGQSESQGLDQV